MKKIVKTIIYITILRFVSSLVLIELYKLNRLYISINFEPSNILLIASNLLEYITYGLFILIIFPITINTDKNELLLLSKVSILLFVIFDIIIAFFLIMFPYLINTILGTVKYFKEFYLILGMLGLLQYIRVKKNVINE